MAFRMTVTEAPDRTTVRLAGRLGDDAVAPLLDACARARQPIVLDMSQVTGASDATVLLLRRLGREGVHLAGASQYVTMLLADAPPVAVARPSGGRPRSGSPAPAARRRREGKSPGARGPKGGCP
jgi:hypothetical protein